MYPFMFFTRQCHLREAMGHSISVRVPGILFMGKSAFFGGRVSELQLPAASLLWASVKWVSSHSGGQVRRGF